MQPSSQTMPGIFPFSCHAIERHEAGKIHVHKRAACKREYLVYSASQFRCKQFKQCAQTFASWWKTWKHGEKQFAENSSPLHCTGVKKYYVFLFYFRVKIITALRNGTLRFSNVERTKQKQDKLYEAFCVAQLLLVPFPEPLETGSKIMNLLKRLTTLQQFISISTSPFQESCIVQLVLSLFPFSVSFNKVSMQQLDQLTIHNLRRRSGNATK